MIFFLKSFLCLLIRLWLQSFLLLIAAGNVQVPTMFQPRGLSFFSTGKLSSEPERTQLDAAVNHRQLKVPGKQMFRFLSLLIFIWVYWVFLRSCTVYLNGYLILSFFFFNFIKIKMIFMSSHSRNHCRVTIIIWASSLTTQYLSHR